MTLKKIVFLTTLILLTFNCFTQNIQIQGKLLDSTHKTAISYAHVIIKSINDSIIGGVLTNEKGDFKISVKIQPEIKVFISIVGFSNKEIVYKTDKNKTAYKIGEILLQPSKIILGEFSTQANQTYVTQKFDRKVYNIKESKASASKSVLDLLKILPGIVVDNNGNIRLKGETATIYIDDQPMIYIYPKIEMIPVTQVDKIEIIDAAMQTGGNGRGGIINFKMKTVKYDGLSGLISTEAGTSNIKNIENTDNFLNLNFRKKKITLFNNLSYNTSFERNEYLSKSILNNYNPIINQSSTYNSEFNSTTLFNYIGILYNPNSKTRARVGFGYNDFYYENLSKGDFSEIQNDITNLKYNNNSKHRSSQPYKGISFGFYHSFDTLDTYIRAFGGIQEQKPCFEDQNQFLYQVVNNNQSNLISESNSYDNSKNPNSFLTIFYNHSINTKSRWNLSYSFDLQKDKNNNSLFSNKTEVLTEKGENTSNIQKHKLSYRIGTQLKKWKIDVGLNAEYNILKGDFIRFNTNLEDTILSANKAFLLFLPSSTLSYSLNNQSEIKLSISKTSQAPYFFQLNDFIKKYNDYSWSTGNSNLKPSDYYSIYLGYSYFKETFNFTSELFYTTTNNKIEYISYPLSSTLSINRPDNIAKKEAIGVDLSSWFQVISNLSISISSSLYNTIIDISSIVNMASYYNLNTYELFEKKKQFGYNIKANIDFNYKKFNSSLYAYYFSKEISTSGYNKQWISSSLNINRKFLKNKLMVSFNINHLFDDLVEHGSHYEKFDKITDNINYGTIYKRNYTLTLRYSFRQGDRNTKDIKL